MRATELNKINKLIISVDDIANELSISSESARVTANRYVKNGFLYRVKRNYYVTVSKLQSLSENELFQIANIIYVPSYISLTSALSYYNISTQLLQNVVESISSKSSQQFTVDDKEFRIFKVKKSFYTGFNLENDFFIATPSKALADAVYLSSLGKYKCDFDAVNFRKLNKVEINNFLKDTGKKTKAYWKSLCKHYKI